MLLDPLRQPTTRVVCERVYAARHELYRQHIPDNLWRVYVDRHTWASLRAEHGLPRDPDGTERIFGLRLFVDDYLTRERPDRPAIVLRSEVVA